MKRGLEVKYLTASSYTVAGTGNNVKEVTAAVETACKEAVEAVEKSGGEGGFTMQER
jgi:translation initiation factor 2 alpha subunit (eIF-2alpha)